MTINTHAVVGNDVNGNIIKGNPEEFFGLSLFCYLDILGFSNHITKNMHSNNSKCIETLLFMKNKVDNKNKIGTYSDDSTFQNYVYSSKIMSISDSISISIAVPEKFDFFEIEIIFYKLLFDIINNWNNLINIGFTLRGAIEFGPIYWNEKDIIGPVLIETYKIERIANESRIIIGPRFIDLLTTFYSFNIFKKKDSIVDHFLVDKDGMIILNPKKLLLINDNSNINKLISIQSQCKKRSKEYNKYTKLIKLLNHKIVLLKPTEKDFSNYFYHPKLRYDRNDSLNLSWQSPHLIESIDFYYCKIKCKSCNQYFQSPICIQKSIIPDYYKKIIEKCDISLNNNNIDLTITNVVCSLCKNIKSYNFYEIYIHNKIIKGNTIKPYKIINCNNCGYTFLSPIQIIDIISYSEKNINLQIKCPHCNQTTCQGNPYTPFMKKLDSIILPNKIY